MCKSDKPSFRKAVNSNGAETGFHSPNENAVVVIDCGNFLRKVKWEKRETYKDLVSRYVNYAKVNYQQCNIVFDGYSKERSTDNENRRKAAGKKKDL